MLSLESGKYIFKYLTTRENIFSVQMMIMINLFVYPTLKTRLMKVKDCYDMVKGKVVIFFIYSSGFYIGFYFGFTFLLLY